MKKYTASEILDDIPFFDNVRHVTRVIEVGLGPFFTFYHRFKAITTDHLPTTIDHRRPNCAALQVCFCAPILHTHLTDRILGLPYRQYS